MTGCLHRQGVFDFFETAAAEKLNVENLLLAGRALQSDAVLTGLSLRLSRHLCSSAFDQRQWGRGAGPYVSTRCRAARAVDSIVNDVLPKLQSVRSPDELIASRVNTR
jgi:hypothetical protein